MTSWGRKKESKGMFVSPHLDINSLGHLTIGGEDTVELAERYG